MVSILALPGITVVQCLSIASPLFVAVKRQELVLQNKTLLLISDVSMLPWFSTNLFSDVWKRACWDIADAMSMLYGTRAALLDKHCLL